MSRERNASTIAEVLGLEDSPSSRLADQLVNEGYRLAAVIKKRRQDLGLSKSDVAERLGVNESVVSDIENNVSGYRLRDMFVLCLSLGLELHLSTNEYDSAVERSASSD